MKFIVKVKYAKVMPNGKQKQVVEPYLIQGESYSDCEARVYAHIGDYIKGQFEIVKMQPYLVDSMIGSGENFYLVKQQYTDVDDREIKYKLLVMANDIEQAKEFVIKANEEWSSNKVEIKSITSLDILDYYPLNDGTLQDEEDEEASVKDDYNTRFRAQIYEDNTRLQAQFLVNRFYEVQTDGENMDYDSAVECAKIAVDTIIESQCLHYPEDRLYWKSVMKELDFLKNQDQDGTSEIH
jgi:CRISPR/Cas system-associated protein Cas5 (RAMP superfamily)